MSKVRRWVCIPDTQIKPGVPLGHIPAIGRYCAEWKPDVIVQLGDWADFPSLSSYDEGKLAMEGRRYEEDCAVANDALATLTKEILRPKGYRPRRIKLRGNHDGFANGGRPHRFIQANPKLAGKISPKDMIDKSLGWEVHEFLEVVEVDKILLSHYLVNPKTGRPWGGNAQYKLKQAHQSFVIGHTQGLDSAMLPLPNGGRIRGLVSGSCYLHQEEYLGPQGSNEWRGIVVLHEVRDGDWDQMEVSLNFLMRKYA